MENYYTLEGNARGKEPFFVLTIRHRLLSGVFLFSKLSEAVAYLEEVKETHGGPILYESQSTWPETVSIVREFQNNRHLKIGQHGRTYDDRLFSC